MRVSAPVSVWATVFARAALFDKRWRRLRRVFSDVLPLAGGGRFTPARRALERPIAIACSWNVRHVCPGECGPFLHARIRRPAWRELCPALITPGSFECLPFGHTSFQGQWFTTERAACLTGVLAAGLADMLGVDLAGVLAVWRCCGARRAAISCASARSQFS